MSKVEFCIFTLKFKYNIRFSKQMAYLYRENTYLFALSSTRCLYACFNATTTIRFYVSIGHDLNSEIGAKQDSFHCE